MYSRFFNICNKLLKCTYVYLSLFHSNVSNIQHGVRIEYLHLFNKENIQIKSSSFLHTFSHPDKNNNSANRIISSRRGEERFQYIYSDLQTSTDSRDSSSNSTVIPHAIQSSHARKHTYRI